MFLFGIRVSVPLIIEEGAVFDDFLFLFKEFGTMRKLGSRAGKIELGSRRIKGFIFGDIFDSTKDGDLIWRPIELVFSISGVDFAGKFVEFLLKALFERRVIVEFILKLTKVEHL